MVRLSNKDKKQAREELLRQQQKSRQSEQENEWEYEQSKREYYSKHSHRSYRFSYEETNYSSRKQHQPTLIKESCFNKKDYYKYLGIERNATIEIIKKAYKQKALQYHPGK